MSNPKDLARPDRLMSLLILDSASDDFESLGDIQTQIERIVLTHELELLDQGMENEIRMLVQEDLLDAFRYSHQDQNFCLLAQPADLTDLNDVYFLISKAGRLAMNSDEVSEVYDALNLWE
jgi:hypothetical protein